MPSFLPAATDDPVAARLLDDYFAARARGFTTHADGYRVNRPEPARFVPPVGEFLLVHDDAGEAVGCGGIRRIDDVDGLRTYEVKHVWIDESVRGRGWSRLLMDELERRARSFGAQYAVLDTNESLTAAQHLYRTSGYTEIAAYNDNPNATHWFGKRLD
ncbi:GNAT family N-acetyltransferase [Agromyces larvae]|uniref:GNAT family N-acetyltransferase n=1 Tax=Agromyces larvae TaxID=2929802 RepID=A0ABY4BZR7_9MICO|nr:GNAT family N-acetyltransferase [Agromyces larvae]UOE44736.1 GNAT family N-acetyltransferase [Agromyces larvae]